MSRHSSSFPATAIAAMVFLASSGHAADQSSINVGVDLQLSPPEAHVSGLQDVSYNLIDTWPIHVIEDQQTFCVFSPSQFFSMEIRGSSKGPDGAGGFWIRDDAQANPVLQYLSYDVLIHDIFSGSPKAIGSNANGAFFNGVAESGIDSNDFNQDETCTDGENLRLTFTMAFPETVLGGGHSNREVVNNLLDGQQHSFTDVLTVIVAPDL